jgi:hypothetical protein
VVTFEYDGITSPQQVKHLRIYDTGIGAVPKPDTVFPDDKSARLGSVMGGGKRFDFKIPDLKPLMIPAYMTIYPFVRSAPVMEKFIERSSGRIDRDSKTAGKHVKAFNMVAVLMRHQHRINLPGIKA